MITELNFVSNNCLKCTPNSKDYERIKSNSFAISSTDLYCLYLLSCEGADVFDFKTFYTYTKANLYYDKFICTHGTEFYYYVMFKEDFFNAHKNLILYYTAKCARRLNDLNAVVPAVGTTVYTRD